MLTDILILIFLFISLFSGVLLIVYSARGRQVKGAENCTPAISKDEAEMLRTVGIVITVASILLIFVTIWRLRSGKQLKVDTKFSQNRDFYQGQRSLRTKARVEAKTRRIQSKFNDTP